MTRNCGVALGVDFRGVGAGYVGPVLHREVPGSDVKVDACWGIQRRWIEHDTGGYWDFCTFPLMDADVETVANWFMPSPDDFDYSGVAAQCRINQGYCVTTGGAGLPDVINSTGMIRTMEQVLVDLALDEPAGLNYIDRRIEVLLAVTARTLEAAKGGIDLLSTWASTPSRHSSRKRRTWTPPTSNAPMAAVWPSTGASRRRGRSPRAPSMKPLRPAAGHWRS